MPAFQKVAPKNDEKLLSINCGRPISNEDRRGTLQLFLSTQLELGSSIAWTLSKNPEGGNQHILDEILLMLRSKDYCKEFALSHEVVAALDVSGTELIYIYCSLKKGDFVFELLRHKYDAYN